MEQYFALSNYIKYKYVFLTMAKKNDKAISDMALIRKFLIK